MAISYRIDPSAGIIFAEFDGPVTDRELYDASERLWSDPAYRPEYSRLIDLTRADFTNLTQDSVRRIGGQNRKVRIGRVALVAASDVAYGMSRMYQVYLSGIESGIFQSRSAALEWIAKGGPCDPEVGL